MEETTPLEMAQQDAIEGAAKQRIINHMNRDHQDSLARCLQHFCKLSSFSARKARLEDVSFDALTISSSRGTRHVLPLNPPLSSWPEMRPRVVKMDKEAIDQLQLSIVTVKRYARPDKAWQLSVLVGTALTAALFINRSMSRPKSIASESVLKIMPVLAYWLDQLVPWAFYGLSAIHVVESYYFYFNRLSRHSVPILSQVWWSWMLTCLSGGVVAWAKFDDVVAEEKARKEKAQH